jgi:hypothetical protein
MLSNDLQSLREFFHRHRSEGVVLRAATVQHLVASLDVASADAEALESCYAMAAADLTTGVSPVADISDIPATVASLTAYRQRRDLERYYVPVYRTRPLPDRPDGAA